MPSTVHPTVHPSFSQQNTFCLPLNQVETMPSTVHPTVHPPWLRPLIRDRFPSLPIARKPTYQTRLGEIEMLSLNRDYFKSKPLEIPQITILLDNGYHPEHLTKELEKFIHRLRQKSSFSFQKNHRKHKKKRQENQDLFQLK